jgi:hypothetical protein
MRQEEINQAQQDGKREAPELNQIQLHIHLATQSKIMSITIHIIITTNITITNPKQIVQRNERRKRRKKIQLIQFNKHPTGLIRSTCGGRLRDQTRCIRSW